LPATPTSSTDAGTHPAGSLGAGNWARNQGVSREEIMSSEYDKKNEPGQGQRDDKSTGGRQGQNPQGGQGGREGTDKENPREGQGGSQNPGGSQRKPGQSGETETE
jgi:hypothetical protein